MAKILLIDDDIFMRNLYYRAFTYAGHEIEMAEDGEKGILKVNEFIPDIVLLDILMPGMSGIDVLQKLKNNTMTAAIPVIMLTNITSGTIENAERAVGMGAVTYLIKSDHDPAHVVELTEEIMTRTAA